MSKMLATGLFTVVMLGISMLLEEKTSPPRDKPPLKRKPAPKRHLEPASKPQNKEKMKQNDTAEYAEWLKPHIERQKRLAEIRKRKRKLHDEVRKQAFRDNVDWAHRTNYGLNQRNRSE